MLHGPRYSGVSWVVNSKKAVVHTIKVWPYLPGSRRNMESPKTPTLISYHDGKQRWGFKADIDKSTRCFKVALDDNLNAHQEILDGMGEATSSQLMVDAKQLTVDYLRNIWSYTQENIKKYNGPGWGNIYSLKVVLGVPAMWGPDTRGRFKDTAKEAGLPEDLHIVSEPEAAALAVFRDRIESGIMSEANVNVC